MEFHGAVRRSHSSHACGIEQVEEKGKEEEGEGRKRKGEGREFGTLELHVKLLFGFNIYLR